MSTASDGERGAFDELDRHERHHARYNAAFRAAYERGSTIEQAHEAARRACMGQSAEEGETKE